MKNIPLFIRTAGDSEERIRETRVKKNKDKNSVEVAHPGETFAAEAVGNLGLAHTNQQAQDAAIAVLNKTPEAFPYRGPPKVASDVIEKIKVTAKKLEQLGLKSYSDKLLSLAANGENPFGGPEPDFFDLLEDAPGVQGEEKQPEIQEKAKKVKTKKEKDLQAQIDALKAENANLGMGEQEILQKAVEDEKAKSKAPSPQSEQKDKEISEKWKNKTQQVARVNPEVAAQVAATIAATPASAPTKFKSFLGGTGNAIGKGIGIVGAIASIYNMVQEGPNLANVAGAGLSILPFFVGSAALPVSAAVLAGALLYKAFTGSFKEDFDTDIGDAIDEVKKLTSDSSDISKKHGDALIESLTNLRLAYRSVNETSDVSKIETALAVMKKETGELNSEVNSLKSALQSTDYSFIRNTLGFDYSKLDNVIEDIQTGINDVGNTFAREAGKIWNDVKEAAKADISGSTGLTGGDISTTPAVNDSERIKGIQRYLNEAEGADLVETGTFDGATYNELQKILDKLADMGVTEVNMQMLKNQSYDSLYDLRNVLRNWMNRTTEKATKY